MQQIINYFIKNSSKLLFLLLLSISLALIVQSHSFHRSKVISSANFLSGSVYQEINNANSYLSLKGQNEILIQENAKLKNLLLNIKDTTAIKQLDSIKGVKTSSIIVSKIIKNSYNVHQNYLTINSGSLQGVKRDMAVINNLGIIGRIDEVSPHYATVISVLNTQSIINAKLKNSNHFGSLTWDGKSTGFVQLVDIPRLAAIRKGDTIVTGGQSLIFPENIDIGVVEKRFKDDQTNYYTLDIKLFNDMTNLGTVYILKSKNTAEILELENRRKRNE